MKNKNIRFNPLWSSAMALLAFSTLTKADGSVAASHSRCELRGPVLTSAFGFSLNGKSCPKQRKSRQRPLSSRRIDFEPDTLDTSGQESGSESLDPDPDFLPDWQVTQTLTYHWRQYAGTSLCSKVPFQLLVLPADTEPGLIVEEAQLGEHGCFCVAIRPTAAKGQAALYFNADEGQLDTHLSTLEINGKPVPLDQLEPLGVEALVQGHGLELSATLVEEFKGVLQQTSIRLDASQLKVRENPKGQGEQGERSTPPPPNDQAAGEGVTRDGGVQGGGSGIRGGGLGGSGDGRDPRKPGGAEGGGDIDLELAKLDLNDKNQEELDRLLIKAVEQGNLDIVDKFLLEGATQGRDGSCMDALRLAVEKKDESMVELILSYADWRLTEKLNNVRDNIKSVIVILEQSEKRYEEIQEKLRMMLETIKAKRPN